MYVILGLVLFVLIIICISSSNKNAGINKDSRFFELSKTTYNEVANDTGKYGEYLTYEELKDFEETGAKFLMNLYIPKVNGGTTEIDMLMINQDGIYVIESKNYGGYIFANKNNQYWTQTLPGSYGSTTKNQLYNPMLQNESHINHLERLLNNDKINYFSIVVFSDRCQFKTKMEYLYNSIVIHRSNIHFAVKILGSTTYNKLSNYEIDSIYNRLVPYTNVSEEVKQEHIKRIKEKYKKEN